jgi:CoA:oxalate CoA-transferase
MRPLEGLTVLDLSWHLAGPFCTLVLGDLGARIIKVERPGSLGGYDPGGVARHKFQGEDVHYIALNRNKESIVLDLKDPVDHAAFLQLARRADVVFNNFRPGTMQKLGLGFEALKAVNSRIVLANLSAFGATGPDKDRPGVDLVIQAESGGMSMTGEPGRPPVRAGIPIADIAGGMWTAISIMAAIRDREQHGAGAREIDISLFDAHLSFIPYFTAYLTTNGHVPGPQGSGGHSPSYAAFRTKDDKHIVLAVIDQKPWLALCEALEAPHLIQDLRFASAKLRIENGLELTPLLAEIIAQRPADEWVKRLKAHKLPAGKVNDLRETLEHPQVGARDMLVDIDYVKGGVLKLVGTPVKMTGFEPKYVSPPLIGQHTDQVLAEFGIQRQAAQ